MSVCHKHAKSFLSGLPLRPSTPSCRASPVPLRQLGEAVSAHGHTGLFSHQTPIFPTTLGTRCPLPPSAPGASRRSWGGHLG